DKSDMGHRSAYAISGDGGLPIEDLRRGQHRWYFQKSILRCGKITWPKTELQKLTFVVIQGGLGGRDAIICGRTCPEAHSVSLVEPARPGERLHRLSC